MEQTKHTTPKAPARAKKTKKKSAGSLFTKCCGSGRTEDDGTPPPPPTTPSSPSPGINGEDNRTYPSTTMGSKTYEQIKRECLSSNTLWEDPDFPADSSVLFKNGILYNVKWKRPKEISKTPRYIIDNVGYYDMDQGSLGNCWFVASVATVAASPQSDTLSLRVVPRPEDQGFEKGQYCGAFRFTFWSYGKWMEVVVDDRLPTFNGKLIYVSNKKNPDEYWCPLLEKAFAKFKGNYDVLDGGRVHNSLVDLTGGIGEMVELKDRITDSELTKMLINCQSMNSIMGGAIFNQTAYVRETLKDNGLYEGHAYAILQIKQINQARGTTTILHLRNPWGNGEWNGAWSDGSPEWRSLSAEDRSRTYKTRDDGEFWISVEDFRKNFDELELCHLTPDALTSEIADNLDKSNWKVTEHYGSWVYGLSAGGPPVSFTSKKFWSNPQFELSLKDATKPTTVVISLFEIDSLVSRPVGDISIGFVIFRLKEGEKPNRITASNFYQYTPRLIETSGPYWPYRERTVRFVMDPGEHVIVPCTFNAGQEAEFYMRVFAEDEVTSTPVVEPDRPGDNSVPPSPKDITDRAIDVAFENLATDAGVIDAKDLVLVFSAGLEASGDEKDKMSLETCRCLIGLSNTQSSKGLVDKQGVFKVWTDLQSWRKAFRIIDLDKSKSIDGSELKKLYEIIDLYVGEEAIKAIMKRYGGKDGRITEEDFLQSFCKTLHLYRTYKEMESNKKLNMTLDEWMGVGLRT